MKKINNVVLCLLLLFITSSCKSQINTAKAKTFVKSINDSIICNGKTLSTYNLPFFSFKSQNSSELLNEIVKKEVLDFVFVDKEEVIDSSSLKKAISSFVSYANTNCCANKCYSFNGCDYNISFFEKNIISIRLNIETYSAYLSNNSYLYNFDIDESKLIISEQFFENEKSSLTKLLQEKVNIDFPDEFKISNIPDLWYLTKNKEGINGVVFSNGLNENSRNFEDQIPLYNVFLSLEELNPFITANYKRKLGLK